MSGKAPNSLGGQGYRQIMCDVAISTDPAGQKVYVFDNSVWIQYETDIGKADADGLETLAYKIGIGPMALSLPPRLWVAYTRDSHHRATHVTFDSAETKSVALPKAD